MFRKIAHITISLLLLSTTIGYSISEHYCGERIVSVEINQEAKSCCDMTNNCCHTETVFFQLKNDYTVTSASHDYSIVELDLLFASITLYPIVDNDINTNLFVKESPPPLKIQTKRSYLQTYLC